MGRDRLLSDDVLINVYINFYDDFNTKHYLANCSDVSEKGRIDLKCNSE